MLPCQVPSAPRNPPVVGRLRNARHGWDWSFDVNHLHHVPRDLHDHHWPPSVGLIRRLGLWIVSRKPPGGTASLMRVRRCDFLLFPPPAGPEIPI
jgi:hypothetical protein